MPGGLVAIFDVDYASLSFAYPDADLARRVEDALRSALVSNPRVMRDIPRLVRQTGLELIAVTPHLYADIGKGGSSRISSSCTAARSPAPVC